MALNTMTITLCGGDNAKFSNWVKAMEVIPITSPLELKIGAPELPGLAGMVYAKKGIVASPRTVLGGSEAAPEK
jgi:hypothetical protein